MDLSYFWGISTDRKRTKVYIDIAYFVQRRNHANITVWSNNDYGTGLVVDPVILVSVTSTALEIPVVNKNPGIMWIRCDGWQAEKQEKKTNLDQWDRRRGGSFLQPSRMLVFVSEHTEIMSNMVKIWPEGANFPRTPSSSFARSSIIPSCPESDVSPMNKIILKRASEGKRSWISNGRQSAALKNTCGRTRCPMTRFFA